MGLALIFGFFTGLTLFFGSFTGFAISFFARLAISIFAYFFETLFVSLGLFHSIFTGLALFFGFLTGFALGLLTLSILTRLAIALCSQSSLFGNGVSRDNGVRMGEKIEEPAR